MILLCCICKSRPRKYYVNSDQIGMTVEAFIDYPTAREL